MCIRDRVVPLLSHFADKTEILSPVPQGSVLGPDLYPIYAADVVAIGDTVVVTFCRQH